MPRTDRKVEDEFAFLVRQWLKRKKLTDAARDKGDHAELDKTVRRLKETARKMREMLAGKKVLR
jgi:hypothetical protein